MSGRMRDIVLVGVAFAALIALATFSLAVDFGLLLGIAGGIAVAALVELLRLLRMRYVRTGTTSTRRRATTAASAAVIALAVGVAAVSLAPDPAPEPGSTIVVDSFGGEPWLAYTDDPTGTDVDPEFDGLPWLPFTDTGTVSVETTASHGGVHTDATLDTPLHFVFDECCVTVTPEETTREFSVSARGTAKLCPDCFPEADESLGAGGLSFSVPSRIVTSTHAGLFVREAQGTADWSQAEIKTAPAHFALSEVRIEPPHGPVSEAVDVELVDMPTGSFLEAAEARDPKPHDPCNGLQDVTWRAASGSGDVYFKYLTPPWNQVGPVVTPFTSVPKFVAFVLAAFATLIGFARMRAYGWLLDDRVKPVAQKVWRKRPRSES